MPAALNWIADVAVDSDVPEHRRVQIIVRKDTATVSNLGTVVVEKSGVVAVEHPESRSALIRFDDGTAWAAQLPAPARGGCGCS